MNIRPYIHFYKSIAPFIMVFSVMGIVGFGMLYGFIFFLTFGFGFGFAAFQVIYKDQWFTYQNLGITKWKLFKSAFLLHVCTGLLLFLFLFILITVLNGGFGFT